MSVFEHCGNCEAECNITYRNSVFLDFLYIRVFIISNEKLSIFKVWSFVLEQGKMHSKRVCHHSVASAQVGSPKSYNNWQNRETNHTITRVMNTVSVVDIPALFVDNETCLSSPLGVEMGLIKDHQMKGNSYHNSTTYPRFGRLAGLSAWCAKKDPYIFQVDLIVLHYICAVATQGFYQQGYFVAQYRLALKKDGQGTVYADSNGIKVSNCTFWRDLSRADGPRPIIRKRAG